MSEHDELPDGSKLFASLTTSLSKEQVAQLYGSRGWVIRKCSWHDFEVRSPWAELVIDGESPILLHGPVAQVEKNAATILAVLKESRVSYTAECYGDDNELLSRYVWPTSGD